MPTKPPYPRVSFAAPPPEAGDARSFTPSRTLLREQSEMGKQFPRVVAPPRSGSVNATAIPTSARASLNSFHSELQDLIARAKTNRSAFAELIAIARSGATARRPVLDLLRRTDLESAIVGTGPVEDDCGISCGRRGDSCLTSCGDGSCGISCQGQTCHVSCAERTCGLSCVGNTCVQSCDDSCGVSCEDSCYHNSNKATACLRFESCIAAGSCLGGSCLDLASCAGASVQCLDSQVCTFSDDCQGESDCATSGPCENFGSGGCIRFESCVAQGSCLGESRLVECAAVSCANSNDCGESADCLDARSGTCLQNDSCLLNSVAGTEAGFAPRATTGLRPVVFRAFSRGRR